MHFTIGPIAISASSASGGAGTPVLTPVAIGVLPSGDTTQKLGSYAPIMEFTMVEGQLSATEAGGGTPTLDVKLQGSFDGTNWFDILTFTQLTTAGANQAWIQRDIATTGKPFGKFNRLTSTAGSASGVAVWTAAVYLHYIGFGAGA